MPLLIYFEHNRSQLEDMQDINSDFLPYLHGFFNVFTHQCSYNFFLACSELTNL